MTGGAYVCVVDGCDRTPLDGPLFRVSPKGQPFAGMCREHYDELAGAEW